MGKIGFIWWVAVVIGVCGIFMHQGMISISGFSSFWMVTIAFMLLALAELFSK